MCGIVGLFLKDRKLESELGSLLSGMLGTMCERGPDSAGFAVYGRETPGQVKLTLRLKDGVSAAAAQTLVKSAAGAVPETVVRDTHVVVAIPLHAEAAVRKAVAESGEGIEIVGAGRRMEIFKEVGRPDDVAERFPENVRDSPEEIGALTLATPGGARVGDVDVPVLVTVCTPVTQQRGWWPTASRTCVMSWHWQISFAPAA